LAQGYIICRALLSVLSPRPWSIGLSKYFVMVQPLQPPLDALLQPLPRGSSPPFQASQLVTSGPAVIYAIRRPG